MNRSAAGPPEEFVAFVARRAPGLRTAAHALTGNDRLAESLVDDLLGAVAVRWRWFTFSERRFGRTDAAGRYLDRLFGREAPGWRLPVYGEEPERPRLRDWYGPELTEGAAAELAEHVWGSGGGLRRRRWLVAGGVVGVLIIGLCAVPKDRPPAEVPPPPVPTALPPLVDVVPPFADQLRLPVRRTALPSMVSFERAQSAGLLSSNGVRRALAISQTVGSAPMVLGDDGLVRQMDQNLVADVWPTPHQPVAPLTTSSLSPDGSQAAFVGVDVVTVVDLGVAVAHPYPALSLSTAVVWLTAGTLLVSGPSGSLLLDVRTGVTTPTVLEAQHTLSVRGAAPPPAPTLPVQPPGTTSPQPSAGPGTPALDLPAAVTDRIVALLPLGEPATAPARLRRYPGGSTADTTITGDRISWLGPWRSPGFLYAGPSGRAIRDCDVTYLGIPERYGRAEAVTVVVNSTTGTVERALVVPVAAGSPAGGALVAGWLDPDTALVRTGDSDNQHLLAWRVTDGELRLVAVVDRDWLLSVSDLTPPS